MVSDEAEPGLRVGGGFPHHGFDEVWAIVADEGVRLSRAMARDGASEGDILARMRAQATDEERLARADIVLENNGSLEELRMAVENLLQ